SHWVDLGLDAESPVRAIKSVGNYGEIFERNVGKKTPLGLDRGLNQLWSKGGILYAAPVR
ncbi:MAG: amino acid ABC transporter substrate-binding protein, partial [Deltaproteobacteria bacterium]|nr:amino acid ABC transporter substrate-binding protein [Deltaproteobacteria bacterium]